MSDTCIVFDLDDTLFKERDFLISAYRHIADILAYQNASSEEIFQFMYDAYVHNKDVFFEVLKKIKTEITKEDLLSEYRCHYPYIKMDSKTEELFEYLKEKGVEIGLLTDGRSITQRNKIRALGLFNYIKNSNIIISEEFGSEKPSPLNYKYFESQYPSITNFVYVGDNPQKDFVTPNKLGWKTFGLLDNGENIHKQVDTDRRCQPQIWVKALNELIPHLD